MIMVDVAIKATYTEFTCPGTDANALKAEVARLVQEANAKLELDIANLGLIKRQTRAMVDAHIYTEVLI